MVALNKKTAFILQYIGYSRPIYKILTLKKNLQNPLDYTLGCHLLT